MNLTPDFFLENDQLKIRVNESGAELHSVFSTQHHIEYLWQAEKEVWARHAPILFPIVGRLKNNTYTYHENAYTLPQHGFARDERFTCVEQTADTLVFELTANEKTLPVFPFHFSLQVKYALATDCLKISYQVFNPDNSDLYFSLGAHPGFNCPLLPGESPEDYVIQFPGKDSITCHQLADGLLTEDTYTLSLQEQALPVSKVFSANDALVSMNHQVYELSLVSQKSKHGVTMQCKHWPCFGIWSKQPSGTFICLEPWHGVADTRQANGNLPDKTAIVRLLTQRNFSCHYTLQFF